MPRIDVSGATLQLGDETLTISALDIKGPDVGRVTSALSNTGVAQVRCTVTVELAGDQPQFDRKNAVDAESPGEPVDGGTTGGPADVGPTTRDQGLRTNVGGSSEAKDAVQANAGTPTDAIESDFQGWLADYVSITDHRIPKHTTKVFQEWRKSYRARRAEGWDADELRLAIVGAWHDEHRRSNGYTTADSILRPTRIGALIEKGRTQKERDARVQSGQQRTTGSFTSMAQREQHIRDQSAQADNATIERVNQIISLLVSASSPPREPDPDLPFDDGNDPAAALQQLEELVGGDAATIVGQWQGLAAQHSSPYAVPYDVRAQFVVNAFGRKVA